MRRETGETGREYSSAHRLPMDTAHATQQKFEEVGATVGKSCTSMTLMAKRLTLPVRYWPDKTGGAMYSKIILRYNPFMYVMLVFACRFFGSNYISI